MPFNVLPSGLDPVDNLKFSGLPISYQFIMIQEMFSLTASSHIQSYTIIITPCRICRDDQSVSNINEVIVQQRATQSIIKNKELIKTTISIISCNLVAINHHIHRGTSWRSQILEVQEREVTDVSSLFTKVYTLSTRRLQHKRKGFSGKQRLKANIFQKKA